MEAQIWHQQYDANVPVSIDYPNIPLADFLQKTAVTFPDNTALIFGGMAPLLGEQHTTITYRQLNALVDRFAAALKRDGLKKGDRVVLYMANCPQFVIAYYGVLRAGGIVVPSNPLYVAREIEHQLKDSGAKFAVVLSLLYPNIKQIRAHTQLEHVIVTNIKEYFPPLLKTLFTLAKEKKDGHRVDISQEPQTVWFDEFLAPAAAKPSPVTISPDDTACLMYTGGTTGVPKGAELTHHNLIANALQSSHWLLGGKGILGEEIMMSALPLIHAYAMTVCMNLSVINGFAQVLIPNPREFKHLLTAIDKHKPTCMPGVPSLYNAIAHHDDVKSGKYKVGSIRYCISGAAGLPVEVQHEFQRRTGGSLVEGYGLSEASPVTHANPLSSGGRIGTIGLPLPDTEVKIIDMDSEKQWLGPNQPGIMCIHGPQVMKGYWQRPEETAHTLREHDGKVWLYTGDVAEMSEDGYFRIVDRQKDIILAAGGFNVYPRDIEERLYEHPKVMEAVAIGVPIQSKDQRAKVFVVLKPGQSTSEEELLAWCREGLAKYKVPKFIVFRDELPKTHVGKILRRILIEEEQQQEQA